MAQAWQGSRLRAPAVGARRLLASRVRAAKPSGVLPPRNVSPRKAPDMSTDRRHPLPRTRTMCAAFLVFAPLAAIAQVGLGETKETICHIPPGNPANLHTITVGEPSVAGHEGHGDFLGVCRCSS